MLFDGAVDMHEYNVAVQQRAMRILAAGLGASSSSLSGSNPDDNNALLLMGNETWRQVTCLLLRQAELRGTRLRQQINPAFVFPGSNDLLRFHHQRLLQREADRRCRVQD